MRNSIQISQVQKCQKGKKGSLPSCLVSVEPLEKATLNAMLFADLAPAKAAVCLLQTGQKGGLGPASQAACHEARRLEHRIQDPGQFASTEPYRLATGMAVCKNTRTRRLTRIPFGENQRNVWNLQPMCLKVSFWMGAAGPRHLADMGPHLCPQIRIERTGCKSFHGALALLRSSKTFLFLVVHCASSFPVYYLSLWGLQAPWEAGTINSSVLQRGALRLRGARIHPKSQKQSGAELGFKLRHHLNAVKCTDTRSTPRAFLQMYAPCSQPIKIQNVSILPEGSLVALPSQ